MEPQELELKIAGLGHNPTSFTRLLISLGDTRPENLIQRNLTGYINGKTRVPNELIVLLTLLYRHPGDAKAVKPRRQGNPAWKKGISGNPGGRPRIMSPEERRARRLLTA